jgi:predicted dehydrogenase
MRPVSLLVLGAGHRGANFARLTAKTIPKARVVAVAEIREGHRRRLAALHDVPDERVFEDWSAALGRERVADAAIIALPDRLHAEVALAAIARGYHVLLEAPMATTLEACRAVVDAAAAAELVVTVAHGLRYAEHAQRLKVLADSGVIGVLMAIQRLASIGYGTFVHRHVRGPWRLEGASGFALLTAGIHDLDWIRSVVGDDRPCARIASFAALRHFCVEAKPKDAGDRCLQCKIERRCPYSALKAYLDRSMVGERGWPLNVVVEDPTPQRVVETLAAGDYGRCVYTSDNDVADTQVVDLDFECGPLASLTLSAFAPAGLRTTSLLGALGQLQCDGRRVEHAEFLTDRSRTIDLPPVEVGPPGTTGDEGRVLQAFVRAVATGDWSSNLSSPSQVLGSYELAFAAELARRTGAVIDVARTPERPTVPERLPPRGERPI